MNLEALQKFAEQSLFDQWETLLSKFQYDTNSIDSWDSETRVLFETIVQQVLHAASLSMMQKKQFSKPSTNGVILGFDHPRRRLLGRNKYSRCPIVGCEPTW